MGIPGCDRGPGDWRVSSVRVPSQQPEEGFAVLLELFRPHPAQGQEFGFGGRLEACHLLEGGIAEDHVGRDAPGIGQALPQGFQLPVESFLAIHRTLGQGWPAAPRRAALRLALLRRRLQRIGLSATQRPLEEVARFLGGGEGLRAWKPRPVTIVDAGARKAFDLRVEVPVEDMARLGRAVEPAGDEIPEGPADLLKPRSIWPAIHPRLLELVRAHRSTILFVNSRRLAERLAAALNDLAGGEIARAHHGSIARDQRLLIEDALKAGRLPALVATSSLELGIDMGAVDLVVQIEAPPSVASRTASSAIDSKPPGSRSSL